MDIKRLQSLQRHVSSVEENCYILAEKLFENKEDDLGLLLIANGHIHDASKFKGIEWKFLNSETKEKDPDLFKLALEQHITTNLHHPEAWNDGIESMDRLHLAEMVCDLKTRSSEFGTDLLEWIKEEATKKYKFSTHGRIYKEIKGFIDMLVDKFK